MTARSARSLAILLTSAIPLWTACIPDTPLKPYPGTPDYVRARLVPVPGGGQVNTDGGNLILERTYISLDTILGTFEVRATYNSVTGAWISNLQMTYDGNRFVGPTGHVVKQAVPGSAKVSANGTILGSSWVRVDTATIKTKGGRAFHFGPGGTLSYLSLASLPYPGLEFTSWTIASSPST